MKIYRENLVKVIVPLLENILDKYAKKTGAKMNGNNPVDYNLKNICKGRAGVLHAGVEAEPPCERIPEEDSRYQLQEGWLGAVLTEISEFNKNGSEYINSCSEALTKSHGIINFLSKKPESRKRIFYRGEHKYYTDIIPRVARKGCKHDKKNPLQVTNCELDYLKKFQTKIIDEKKFKESIFEQSNVPSIDDPQWWAIMSHYEECNGTRMIDLTSSLFCGLFFACVSWKGEIDEDIDGSLYLIPEENWLDEKNEPLKSQHVKDYFYVEGDEDMVRFREASGRNPRLVAQDGFFLWQPKFDQAIELTQIKKFRVFRGAKKNILRELYSIGYTAKRIVRGQRGEILHRQICEDLCLPSD